MEVSGQLHTLDALAPEKELLVPIGWEAGGTPEPVWTQCQREKFLPCPSCPAHSLVTILTELQLLLGTGSN